MIGAAMPPFEEVEEDVDDDLRAPCCVTADAAVLPFDEREDDLRGFRAFRGFLGISFASSRSTWYAFMPLLMRSTALGCSSQTLLYPGSSSSSSSSLKFCFLKIALLLRWNLAILYRFVFN